MKIAHRLTVVAVCLAVSAGAALYQAQGVPELAASADAFLASLDADQSAKARFDFNDEERLNWHFIPRERNGLPLKEMQPHQQSLVHAMMSAALGYEGVMKATTIMSLEDVLRQVEGPSGRFNRDPELYFVSIFGEPSTEGTWAWRIEGHHLAVNVTMRNGQVLASSPMFMGSNPSEVLEGPRAGLRALGADEDRGRDLLNALDANQRGTAVIMDTAPRDIITGNALEASIEGGAAGLAASDMTDAQQALLRLLIGEYTGRMAQGIETETWGAIEDSGFDNVHFAWAGGSERREGHYYRVEGPTFLIEYDNTQNQNNHVHSVFRDYRNDFGGDTLRAHYEAYHTANAE
jgi:hypothetical protein